MNRKIVAVAALTTIITYSVNYALTAQVLRAVSPFSTLAIRMTISAAVLWFLVRLMKREVPRGRTLWVAIGAGALVQGGQFVGCYWALSHGVSPSFVALVIAMTPVTTAVLSAMIFRKRDSLFGVLAVVVGAIAVVVACAPRIAENPAIGPGIFAVIFAMLALALGSLWQGNRLQGVDPITFTAIGVTVAIVPSAALMPTEVTRLPHDVGEWTMLVVVTLIGVIGTVAYAALVRHAGARAASVVFTIIPACTAIAAGIIIGEHITAFAIVGFVLGALACVLRFVADGRATARLRSEPQRSAQPYRQHQTDHSRQP